MFHADPHAGNLLYDQRRQELIILDWALTEHLSRAQRRHLAMLFLMIVLRDPVGTGDAILELSPHGDRRGRSKAKIIRECTTRFIDELPLKYAPGAVDAMGLLERIAFEGVRLPSSLVMFRKALFTLDGILHDISAPDFRMESVMARHLIRNWIGSWKNIGSPLSLGDWILVQCSALLLPGRLTLQGAQTMLQRSRLPSKSAGAENRRMDSRRSAAAGRTIRKGAAGPPRIGSRVRKADAGSGRISEGWRGPMPAYSAE